MSEGALLPRTVLVTGGAGFIGGHLVERLVREGCRVRVLDDFSSGRAENLAGCADEVEIIRGDLCDRGTLDSALEGVALIFHEGAVASVVASVEDPERCHRVNLSGTLALLEAARRHAVRRVVFAASAAAYGDDETLPKVESLPPSCLSPYALQKYACERYLELYSALHGLETVALRYFNVYGARQDPKSDYAAAIPIFMRAALAGESIRIFGDGEQTRDFVHVDDVISANLLAATARGASGQVMNIASGRRTSLNQLVAIIGQCLGRKLDVCYEPPRPGDVRHSWADIARAGELLGYAPRVELESGLARTLEAFQAQG